MFHCKSGRKGPRVIKNYDDILYGLRPLIIISSIIKVSRISDGLRRERCSAKTLTLHPASLVYLSLFSLAIDWIRYLSESKQMTDLLHKSRGPMTVLPNRADSFQNQLTVLGW